MTDEENFDWVVTQLAAAKRRLAAVVEADTKDPSFTGQFGEERLGLMIYVDSLETRLEKLASSKGPGKPEVP